MKRGVGAYPRVKIGILIGVLRPEFPWMLAASAAHTVSTSDPS